MGCIVNFVSGLLPNRQTELAEYLSRNLLYILKYLASDQGSWPLLIGDPVGEKNLFVAPVFALENVSVQRWRVSASSEVNFACDRTGIGSVQEDVRAGPLLDGAGLVFLDCSQEAYLRHLGSQWASQSTLPPPASQFLCKCKYFHSAVALKALLQDHPEGHTLQLLIQRVWVGPRIYICNMMVMMLPLRTPGLAESSCFCLERKRYVLIPLHPLLRV